MSDDLVFDWLYRWAFWKVFLVFIAYALFFVVRVRVSFANYDGEGSYFDHICDFDREDWHSLFNIIIKTDAFWLVAKYGPVFLSLLAAVIWHWWWLKVKELPPLDWIPAMPCRFPFDPPAAPTSLPQAPPATPAPETRRPDSEGLGQPAGGEKRQMVSPVQPPRVASETVGVIRVVDAVQCTKESCSETPRVVAQVDRKPVQAVPPSSSAVDDMIELAQSPSTEQAGVPAVVAAPPQPLPRTGLLRSSKAPKKSAAGKRVTFGKVSVRILPYEVPPVRCKRPLIDAASEQPSKMRNRVRDEPAILKAAVIDVTERRGKASVGSFEEPGNADLAVSGHQDDDINAVFGQSLLRPEEKTAAVSVLGNISGSLGDDFNSARVVTDREIGEAAAQAALDVAGDNDGDLDSLDGDAAQAITSGGSLDLEAVTVAAPAKELLAEASEMDDRMSIELHHENIDDDVEMTDALPAQSEGMEEMSGSDDGWDSPMGNYEIPRGPTTRGGFGFYDYSMDLEDDSMEGIVVEHGQHMDSEMLDAAPPSPALSQYRAAAVAEQRKTAPSSALAQPLTPVGVQQHPIVQASSVGLSYYRSMLANGQKPQRGQPTQQRQGTSNPVAAGQATSLLRSTPGQQVTAARPLPPPPAAGNVRRAAPIAFTMASAAPAVHNPAAAKPQEPAPVANVATHMRRRPLPPPSAAGPVGFAMVAGPPPSKGP